MGDESDQAGMLRTIVVVSMIGLIAIVVIAAIAVVLHSSNASVSNGVDMIDSASSENQADLASRYP